MGFAKLSSSDLISVILSYKMFKVFAKMGNYEPYLKEMVDQRLYALVPRVLNNCKICVFKTIFLMHSITQKSLVFLQDVLKY